MREDGYYWVRRETSRSDNWEIMQWITSGWDNGWYAIADTNKLADVNEQRYKWRDRVAEVGERITRYV